MKQAESMKAIGIVGLGLMGSSIIVSFLKCGYNVIAISPLKEELEIGSQRIREQLLLCSKIGLLPNNIGYYTDKYQVTCDYSLLKSCFLVIECVIELDEIKKKVYGLIEQVVGDEVIIATNTSAIPISYLQQYLNVPQRFMGIHWAEPAYATRFLEITCGRYTLISLAEEVKKDANNWEREPTLLYKDIRGFVTNRLMYAVYREGFALIENGSTNMASLDKCFQYDIGSWITVMGIFRRMDYMGLDNYLKSYQEIFPQLSQNIDVPVKMQTILEKKGRGIHNLIGLYSHQQLTAKRLEKEFSLFNKEIYHLADKYRKKINDLKL